MDNIRRRCRQHPLHVGEGMRHLKPCSGLIGQILMHIAHRHQICDIDLANFLQMGVSNLSAAQQGDSNS
ncbi:MAG: hypothetical protein R3B91_11445 [Planctomycetaceae bacterium]